MDNTKNDTYYIEKLITDLSFINAHMEKTSIEQLYNDELLQDSMMFRIIQISENSNKLSSEYKEAHMEVPWHALYGLRNRIVHDYGGVDLTIFYNTLENDIPELLNIILENY